MRAGALINLLSSLGVLQMSPGGSVVHPKTGEVNALDGMGSSAPKANQEPFLNHATSTYNFLGFDAVDNRAWVNDATGGGLRQGTSSDSWQSQGGVTWSTAKGWPTGVTYAAVRRMLRFKGKLYLLAVDTADSLHKIWRCDPAAGNTAFTWSAPLHTYGAQSSGLYTSLSADENYIYASEYSPQADPTPDVSAYRSADGVTWETIYGPDGGIRHIHCIAADPYNPGHVWMTTGDGLAKSVQRSTDYGATWDIIVASSVWQAVQISFTPDWIYFAGDSQNGIAFKVNRTNLVPKWISPQLLKNFPVQNPAALTDQYYANAWYGAVDPASGDYYASANDASVSGNTAALIMVAAGSSSLTLVSKFGQINSPVEIAGGMLWVGKYRKVLNLY